MGTGEILVLVGIFVFYVKMFVKPLEIPVPEHDDSIDKRIPRCSARWMARLCRKKDCTIVRN